MCDERGTRGDGMRGDVMVSRYQWDVIRGAGKRIS